MFLTYRSVTIVGAPPGPLHGRRAGVVRGERELHRAETVEQQPKVARTREHVRRGIVAVEAEGARGRRHQLQKPSSTGGRKGTRIHPRLLVRRRHEQRARHTRQRGRARAKAARNAFGTGHVAAARGLRARGVGAVAVDASRRVDSASKANSTAARTPARTLREANHGFRRRGARRRAVARWRERSKASSISASVCGGEATSCWSYPASHAVNG